MKIYNEEDKKRLAAIQEQGAQLQALIGELREGVRQDCERYGVADAEAMRWLAIGKTDLQRGLMAITRAVARPEFF